MIPRGSLVRAILALLILAGAFSRFAAANASQPKVIGDNSRTVTISLPGPFNGCSFLDPNANPTSNAVLDLLRPSAFLTNANGNLVGAGGPIATAELTSLQPETVVYTIAPGFTWSNTMPFNGRDLLSWWQHARTLASVRSDGYRAIKTLTLSPDALTVTAVFATPYADWNLLFRDVEARGERPGCAITNLVNRPSLGPYQVSYASTSRVILVMNSQYANDPNRFGRIVLTTGGALPSNDASLFANYSLIVNRAQAQALSAHPSVLSHIGASSTIEEMTFSPASLLTSRLTIREALSWSLDRQSLINALWGSITFSPSVAASAVFSQGQSAYPGQNGSGPLGQTSTTSTTITSGTGTSGLEDCLTCAYVALKSAGYHRTGASWLNANGGVLTVRIVAGPSGLDHATAAMILNQWRRAGIGASLVSETSETSAAAAVAANSADVAIFERPTSTAASYVARSWHGSPFVDTYPSEFRSVSVNTLFTKAIGNFNPTVANATWLSIDQIVMTSYWVRPLFTAPSLVEWSNTVSGVSGSLSVSGFLDQETGWNSISSVQGS
jgi:hypothetical protein